MVQRNSWRARFNEWELSQIDAAAPSSLIGRMAGMLDEWDTARAADKHEPHTAVLKQFLEQKEHDHE